MTQQGLRNGGAVVYKSDRATIRRKIYSAKTRQRMSMARTLGTEGDRLVLPVTPTTETMGRHVSRNGHSHTHSYERHSANTQVTEASWNQARATNACLRNTNSGRPTASIGKTLRSTYVVGWWTRRNSDGSTTWVFGNHSHPESLETVHNRANECTYVRKNEVTPIRKCNFDREAYYKRYPMRVKLVPPDDE